MGLAIMALGCLALAPVALTNEADSGSGDLQQQLEAAEAHVSALRLSLLEEQVRKAHQRGRGRQEEEAFLSAVVEGAGTLASQRPTSDVPGQPVPFWASQPVRPGETMLLGVTFMGNDTKMELSQPPGDWLAASPAGVTEYGCALTVPAKFAYAPFEVRAGGGAALAVNRPVPWFAFGDQGERATPGGWVRIVGEAIGLDIPSQLIIRTSGPPATTHILTARSARRG